MKSKSSIIVVLLLAATVFVGWWQYRAYEKARLKTPLAAQVTFDYKGTVGGLFAVLAEKSGAHYQVNPAVSDRPIEGSFKNSSVIQVQQTVAEKAGLRYSPPLKGSNEIRVNPK